MEEYLEQKIKPLGSLNSAVDSLERSANEFEVMWNDGRWRLLKDDCDDIEAKLRKIKGISARIKGVSDLFLGITNHRIEKNEEKE